MRLASLKICQLRLRKWNFMKTFRRLRLRSIGGTARVSPRDFQLEFVNRTSRRAPCSKSLRLRKNSTNGKATLISWTTVKLPRTRNLIKLSTDRLQSNEDWRVESGALNDTTKWGNFLNCILRLNWTFYLSTAHSIMPSHIKATIERQLYFPSPPATQRNSPRETFSLKKRQAAVLSCLAEALGLMNSATG